MISRDGPYAAAWFSTGTLCVCVRERLGESAAWNQMEFSQNQTDLQTIEIKSISEHSPVFGTSTLGHMIPWTGEVTDQNEFYLTIG